MRKCVDQEGWPDESEEEIGRKNGTVSGHDAGISLANRKPTGKQGAKMEGSQGVCEKYIRDRNAKSQTR